MKNASYILALSVILNSAITAIGIYDRIDHEKSFAESVPITVQVIDTDRIEEVEHHIMEIEQRLDPVVSIAPYTFTFENEIGRGMYESRTPYIDLGNDAVAIGAGYSFYHRSTHQVVNDFLDIGIPVDTAIRYSGAIGLTGQQAFEWMDDNKDLMLTTAQERLLFNIVMVDYEDQIITAINLSKDTFPHVWDDTTHVYDIAELNPVIRPLLFDYVYNLGMTGASEFPKFMQAIIRGDWDTALKEYHREGVTRRNTETRLLIEEIARNY